MAMLQGNIPADLLPAVSKILPSLKNHSIVRKSCSEKDVRISDVENLCKKVGIRMTQPQTDEPMPLGRLLGLLTSFAEFDQSYTKKLSFLDRSDKSDYELPKLKKNMKNVFGLPSIEKPSADALVYQCRKQLVIPTVQIQEEKKKRAELRIGSHSLSMDQFKAEKAKQELSYPAQRKVANALLMMVTNETMLYHFMHKGGVDALFKLVRDSKDYDVLFSCMKAVNTASTHEKYCNMLVSSGVIPTILLLSELGDDDIRHMCSMTLTNLTFYSGSTEADENIVLFGVLPVISIIVSSATRIDTLCYCILNLNNLAQVFDGGDSVVAVRMLLNLATRLEVMTNVANAIFLTDVLKNVSRIIRYLNPLCEESALPLLLNVMDEHFNPKIIVNMAECFMNLSISKKNRRDIAISGVAFHLERIFSTGTPEARAYILRMIGNLLHSGLFHERIARDEILATILDNMMDPDQPAQFSAVCYCFSQLSIQDSSVQTLVRCDAVRISLGAMRSPGDMKEGSQEAMGYILILLVSVSARQEFVHILVNEQHILLPALYHQAVSHIDREKQRQIKLQAAQSGRRRSASTREQPDEGDHTEIVSVLAHNLSLLPEFTASISLSPKLTEMFVNALKALYKGDASTSGEIRILALTSLVNFSLHNRACRACVLGGEVKVEGSKTAGVVVSDDIIEMMKSTGYDDPEVNMRFMALLNIFSSEESLCLKLLDRGAHLVLVSIIGTLSSYHDENYQLQRTRSKSPSKQNRNDVSKAGAGRESVPTKKKSMVMDKLSQDSTLTVLETVTQRLQIQASEESGRGSRHGKQRSSIKARTEEGDELVRDMAGAVAHNLSLRRAVIGPGILQCLLSFSRNCKSLRVLHCVRCLANISMHAKAKLALTKERHLIPILINSMRYGCAEAERVQHYGAQVICNVLATGVDRSVIEELIKRGAVTDIIVVALLRVNGFTIKESLCKALFNLLTRAEFRGQMIDLGVLSTIMELAKLESSEVLELCARCVYNVTCQTSTYAQQIRNIGVPAFLMARASGAVLTHTTSEEGPHGPENLATAASQRKVALDDMGLLSSTTVKLLCGMGLANISFEKKMASLLCSEHGVNAIISVFRLNSNQATYCAAAVLYNTSLLNECTVFTTSVELIPVLMEIVARGPALCIQLATAALLNFTRFPSFHDGLSRHAVGPALKFIDSPTVDEALKLDIVGFLYNMVTELESSRFVAVDNDAVGVLWKIMKTQTDEKVFMMIGRIVKEMCSNAADPIVHKKLMSGSIMRILLKLAKIEVPQLKYDISCCIYDLTKGEGDDTLKLLKWDAMDILFWLTLHDCLNLNDPIRENVGLALRNMTASSRAEAIIVANEDRVIPVMKALIQSNNEDSLKHVAGAIFNLMTIEVSKAAMLKKGVIALIFDLAASGYTSIRHTCSSCLHMAPDNIPDMGDPAVLELVLCLLDVDPNYVMQISELDSSKTGRVGEKFVENPPYILLTVAKTSPFKHNETDFSATWLTLTSTVDKIFSPALVSMPSGRALNDAQLKQMIAEVKAGQHVIPAMQSDHPNHRPFPAKVVPDPQQGSLVVKVGTHIKMNGEMYDQFIDSGTIASPVKRKDKVKSPSDSPQDGGNGGTNAEGWGTFMEGPTPKSNRPGVVAFEDRGDRGDNGGGVRPLTGEGPPLTAPTPNTPLPPHSAQRGARMVGPVGGVGGGGGVGGDGGRKISVDLFGVGAVSASRANMGSSQGKKRSKPQPYKEEQLDTLHTQRSSRSMQDDRNGSRSARSNRSASPSARHDTDTANPYDDDFEIEQDVEEHTLSQSLSHLSQNLSQMSLNTASYGANRVNGSQSLSSIGPIRASQVQFPKVSNKDKIPNNTLGLIKGSARGQSREKKGDLSSSGGYGSFKK